MKHRFLNRMVTGCLALCLTAAMAVPGFAVTTAEYKLENGSERLIYWTQGMVAPQLPTEEEPGDFAAQKVTFGDGSFDAWVMPYQDAKGFYDLTQDPSKDPNSGYAAVAANLTYWWLGNNQDNVNNYLIGKPTQKEQPELANPDHLYDLMAAPAIHNGVDSPIYNLYLQMFPEEYGSDMLLNAFFNGYSRMEAPESGNVWDLAYCNTADQFTPNPQGGYFYPLAGKEPLSHRAELTAMDLKNALAKNQGVAVVLSTGEAYRAVNVWGAEVDTDYELQALYITDSQDDLGLIRFEVTKSEEQYSMAGMDIVGMITLSLGDVHWMDYEFKKPAEPKEEMPKEEPPQQDPPEEEDTQQTPPDSQTQDTVTWNPPTYEWKDGDRVCEATRLSQGTPTRKETAQGVISSQETREPTCLKKGQTTYTAVFEEDWAEDQTKTVDNIDTLEPIWGPTEYKWSQDHRTCTATRTCKHEPDGAHQETVQAVNIFSEKTKNPSSKHPGEHTYTATFNVDWAKEQIETAADIPAKGESWGEVTYSWSRDHRICTAQRVDQNDPDNVQTAEVGATAKETREPTCTEKGQTTYTAKFEEDWAGTHEETVDDIEALGHDWRTVQYEWSEDHRRCTAIRECRRNEDHVESANATITSARTVSPTLNSMGETTYAATFGVDWAEKQTVSVKDIEKLPDLWNQVHYEWQNDNTRCVATRTNQKDPETVQTAVASVSSKKTKAPTSVDKGQTTYTAKFKEDWAKTQTVTVSNIPPVTGPTHNESSNQNNNHHNSNNNGGKITWTDPTYEWSKDYSRCTASRTRTNDKSNVDLTWATVTRKELKAPTCTEKGQAEVTAKFTERWAKDQKMTVDLEPLEHKLQKVAEVPASAGKEGVKAHYECVECHRLFEDAEGKKEIRKEDLTLSRPSVTEGYAILTGVPEKENQVAIAPEKFRKALEDNPGSVGVSIAVGKASVTYDKRDVETILSQAKDSSKLQLEVYRTDSTDSALTLEQIQSLERNHDGSFYMVNLSYVKNGKSLPVTGLSGTSVMVPYSGEKSVKVYRVAEDGSFQDVESSYAASFVTYKGENGVYLLTEQNPAAAVEKHSGGKLGVIIWTSVLVVSGLLVIGLVGFYFYQKKMGAEDDAESLPQFDRKKHPQPEVTEEAADSVDFDLDGDLFNEDGSLTDTYQSYADYVEPAEQADPAVPQFQTADTKKTGPVAPKAPMNPTAAHKPTTAEKIVQKTEAHEKPKDSSKV